MKAHGMSSIIADLDTALEQYQAWLLRQSLADKTCHTYLTQVRQFCTYLKENGVDYCRALGLPTSAAEFVTGLRRKLERIALEVDANYPENAKLVLQRLRGDC